MGYTCLACGKRTGTNYAPEGYVGVASRPWVWCKRCAGRDVKRTSDALRVENWNVYRA